MACTHFACFRGSGLILSLKHKLLILTYFSLSLSFSPHHNDDFPGAIYVVDELDYEQRQSYELLIRATDSVSGVSAEVPVSVLVQDVNDCPPEIEQDSYNITVSERAQFGTAILKVQAKDNDTGKSRGQMMMVFVSALPGPGDGEADREPTTTTTGIVLLLLLG